MIDGLHEALLRAESPWSDARLEAMPDTGLAHWHVRLRGTGVLARVPKQSQIGLPAAGHLTYEAACFDRASASGHVPRLRGVLAPSDGLPRGALLVDEVQGRPLQLPHDLDALVRALAALHALPLPALRAPLLDPPDPLAAIASEVATQAEALPHAGLAAAVQRRIDHERSRLADLAAQTARPPRHLISFDAHPGNFLVDPRGHAWLVDLEKARYGAAALDLAHATLYTSTTWDRASHAVLDAEQVAQAARGWLQALAASGVDSGAEASWVAPLRRAMALWSLTWCAKWRVLSQRPAAQGASGEDWSSELSADALVAHVRDRVDHYLSAEVTDRIFDEIDALERR